MNTEIDKEELERAVLAGVSLEGANLQGADLQGANLIDVEFEGANLQGANLQGANLQGACLRWANLQGANLQGACLRWANLQGANLTDAEFEGAELEGANLQGANLQGTELEGANLIGVNLQGANLQGANLQGTKLQRAELEGANLIGANLIGADLQGAELEGAELQGAELEEAELEGANLQGAELQGAIIGFVADKDIEESRNYDQSLSNREAKTALLWERFDYTAETINKDKAYRSGLYARLFSDEKLKDTENFYLRVLVRAGEEEKSRMVKLGNVEIQLTDDPPEQKYMITEMEVKDWKSYKKASLYIDPLTIMIGTNASGKSNILDALTFLQRIASGFSIYQAIAGDGNLEPLRGGIEWVCRRPEKSFSITCIVKNDQGEQEYKYIIEVQVNGIKAEICGEELKLLQYNSKGERAGESRLYYTQKPSDTEPGIPVFFSTSKQGRNRKIDLNRTNAIIFQAEGLKLTPNVEEGIKTVIGQLRKIFIFDPIPSHMRAYSSFSEKLRSDGSNIAGVLAALEPDVKNSVENTLTEYSKALPEREIKKVWAETVGKFNTDAMLYCEEGWTEANGQHIVDARGMSDGTLRYLAIATAILTREKKEPSCHRGSRQWFTSFKGKIAS